MHEADMRPVTTYREWASRLSPKEKLRGLARDSVIFALSTLARVPRGSSWIRFPYYHHVFDDERAGFERHLRFLRKYGEIISIDDAIGMLASRHLIDGRYFCITFDDGFKNCLTNAVPILVEHRATAAFFVPTRYIGASLERDRDLILGFYKHGRIMMEFLDWDDCRLIARAGMVIGAHSVSHRILSDLADEEVERELRESKEVIEREIGLPCDHFCCPVGRPGLDFHPDREPEIARKVGYRSFLTTRRGSVHRKPGPMMVERDHTLASWGRFQLRYFFSR